MAVHVSGIEDLLQLLYLASSDDERQLKVALVNLH